jgi:hypothetical protein
MGSLLFDVSPIDPLTYVAVCLSLTSAAVLASYVPALRATMVNLVTALRAERRRPLLLQTRRPVPSHHGATAPVFHRRSRSAIYLRPPGNW